MRKRVAVKLLLVLLTGAGLYAAAVVYRAHSALAAGQDLLDHQLWPQAREQLASYLWLHPHAAEARLLMAEALVKDERLPARDAAAQAIACLAEIPDSSPLAAKAKLQQGRLCFLILQKPIRAEQFLRRAIGLEPDNLPAWQLLWTVLDVTGRSELTEEIFWRVYELSPEDERPLRLREWHVRQFFPLTANEELDRMLGILAPGETPTRTSESRRYLRFRESEPEAATNHVAVAQWFQQERDAAFAIQLLDAAAKDLPIANPDSFFLSIDIAARLDLGRFEEADAAFRRWPEEDRGYLYWKWLAIVSDDVRGEYSAALAAYDRAIAIWPGPVEWQLHYRRAGCLARLKKATESAAARERAEGLKLLMVPEVHERLQKALGFLDDPEQLTEIVQFYRKLGRDREADCWQEYIQRLPPRATADPPRRSTEP